MNHSQCVLAVYPMIRGFAFVLFASPSNPIDWGIRYIVVSSSKRNAASLSHIETIVVRYQPDAIVIEDYTEVGSRRSARICRLYHSLTHAAQTKSIDVYRITKTEVQECFAVVGAKTKDEIAGAVARQFPEFEHRLPRKRQVWDPQQTGMGLFVAAALGVAFYRRDKE
jgi:hypothetical protein